MNPNDYAFLCEFLHRRSGLHLGPGKEYLLQGRLIPLAQSLDLKTIEDLVASLRTKRHPDLESAVVEAMTTNETLFFRDKTPFDEMVKELLPEILVARSITRRLRIWSAACSSGQEAYSIAMCLRENFPQLLNGWRIEIVGTDLSTQILNRAEEGLYSQFEIQRGLPIQMLMKYFQQTPNGWQVKQDLRSWTSWKKLNLLENFSNLGPFDLVFCRNVLIYFDNETKAEILARACDILAPDGYLIMGAAETLIGITEKFKRYNTCRAAVYRPAAAVAVR